jgi:hypothetical protein
MSSEQGQSHLYDLDPPASMAHRIARGVVGCVVLVVFILFLWFMLAPDPADGASSPEPVMDSILSMCRQASIPRMFSDIADVAVPLWSRFCNVVQD